MSLSQRKTAVVRLWPVIIIGCLAVAALGAVQTALLGLLGDEHRVSWANVLFQASEWIFLGILTPITYYLGRRFPLQRERIANALAIHAAGAMLLCFGWAFLGVVLRHALGIDWDTSFTRELLDWTLITLPFSFLMYFAFLGTFHAFAYYDEARDRELQATQLAGQLSDARLRALRAQLQPHFLFNALNAINVLVRDQRTTLAARTVDALSDMLRQVLRTDRPHEIALREELELIRQYLEIEQVRFSDRLRVHYDIEAEALDGAVPSFVLQPLVENALRHGLTDRLEDAILEIGARHVGDTLEVWVRDNGRGVATDRATGIGLENTRERLATLYGDRASLTLEADPQGGTVARIRLPWRKILA